MSYSMQDIRQAMVHAGLDYRNQVIRDYQPGQQATPGKIEKMVDLAGAGWDLGKDGEYNDERELEWCGYFVAACARRVGDFLHSDRCVDVHLRRQLGAQGMGSTYRLQAFEHWSPYATPKEISVQEVRRGDIVVVETSGAQPQFGDHITLARGRKTEGHIPTIEGNAQGVLLGDGEYGEGVGTTSRARTEIHTCYRLLPEHFTGTDWSFEE